jgi:hypothetical protein
MARINSKTNWVGSDRPLAPDFNRIENNNQQAFSEIDGIGDDLDTTNSNLATTNSNLATTNINLNDEINARAAGDTNLQLQVNQKQALPSNSSDPGTTSFPIGTMIVAIALSSVIPRNSAVLVYHPTTGNTDYTLFATGTLMPGVWRSRGRIFSDGGFFQYLLQRTA